MRLLLFLILFSTAASAQTYYAGKEYGVAGGASQYFGDLNDNYGVDYVRPYAGAFIRFHLTPYIGIRTSLGYTHVGYDDKFNQNEYQRLRNLNFRSDIIEGSVQAEFNFFRFSTGEVGSRFTPYLTGGVGAFYFDPFTVYNGRRTNLRAIGTEGQNAGFEDRRYGNFALCFPIGVGFKSWIRPGMNFGIEIADRLTLTDYLDDVSTTYVGAEKFPVGSPTAPSPAAILQDRSVEIQPSAPIGRAGKQRGNSQTKDQYMIIQVNLSFQLKSYRCPNYLKEGGLY